MSGLKNGVSYDTETEIITFRVNSSLLSINGVYNMNLTLLSNMVVEGDGDYSFEFTAPSIFIKAKQSLIDKMNISGLDIDVSFEKFDGLGKGMTFNGEIIDWQQLSFLITNYFDVVWGLIKGIVTDYITYALNSIYKVNFQFIN